MKIFFNENVCEEIKKIVLEIAQYQKVMLLFDDDASQDLIFNIYQTVREFVVFNKANITNVTQEELNDGYKLVIYCCCADSYIKFEKDNSDCINIFCPSNEYVLPFLIQKGDLDYNEDFLILATKKFDIKMLASVYFNLFFNHCNKLLFQQDLQINTIESGLQLNAQNLLNFVVGLDKDFEFIDIKILKKCDLLYSDLFLIHVILLNAFISVINSIKDKNTMLVDVYKATQTHDEYIDKLYAMYFGGSFENLIKLNCENLLLFAEKTKRKIIELNEISLCSENWLEEVLNKIKAFSKDEDGLLGYLYLFNVFGT